MKKSNFIRLPDYREYPHEEMRQRAISFRKDMQRRRTVRTFSTRTFPHEIIDECIRPTRSGRSLGGAASKGNIKVCSLTCCRFGLQPGNAGKKLTQTQW